jgi:DNA primase
MDRTHAILAAADAFYQDALWSPEDGQSGREYLCGTRAIAMDVARVSGVGFLPAGEGGEPLVVALRRAGFTDEEILAAPVTRAAEFRRPVDYPAGGGFITFPIRDAVGEVTGFKYRAVPGQARVDAPRYTGTSGDMQGAMFGWHLVTPQDERLLVIEGEIDQLSMETVRLSHPELPRAVAWYGKELTDRRLQWFVERGVRHLTLALDADAGGWDGMLRSGRKLGRAGITHEVLQLPAGLDPNAVLQAGGADILAHLVKHGPRPTLLEAHAQVLANDKVVATDPFYTARTLKETAIATATQLTDVAYTRAAHTARLPVQVLRVTLVDESFAETPTPTPTRVTAAAPPAAHAEAVA